MTIDVVGARDPAMDLRDWTEQARAVHQIAMALAGTSFVPASMRGNAEEIAGCILAGRELGLSPMSSLRSIDIIDGSPALRAIALRGLVQAQGHEVVVRESTETRAVVEGRRKGSAVVQKSVWTLDRAKKAGLANKRNWVTQPQSMLIARATAELCRLIAADVLLAVPYIAEEVGEDAVSDTAAATSKTSSTKRTAQRKPLPELPTVAPFAAEPLAQVMAEPGPSVDDIEPDGVPPADGMSDGMRRALMANYRELGITDRAERLEHASKIVGRKLGSANELSHAEGHDLLAALEAEAARREPQGSEPS